MNTEEILKSLTQPGKMLLFVDDSGTARKPLPELVQDFCVLCGVVIDSNHYQEIVVRVIEHLSLVKTPLERLHATEIVNPSSSSPWKEVSYDYRIASLELASELVIKYSQQMPYMYIGKEQYDEISGRVNAPKHQKRSLKNTYIYSVLRSDWLSSSPYAFFYDSEKHLDGKMKILCLKTKANLLEGGVIEASSKQVIGLQLADFAVYSLNRVFHIREKVKHKDMNQFDRIIVDTYDVIGNRYINMLDN